MRLRLAISVIVLLLATSCAGATAQEQEYTGYLTHGDNITYVQLCDDDDSMFYYIDSLPAGAEEQLASVQGVYSRIAGYQPQSTWYVTFGGRILPDRDYGDNIYGGHISHKIDVTALHDVQSIVHQCPKHYPYAAYSEQ